MNKPFVGTGLCCKLYPKVVYQRVRYIQRYFITEHVITILYCNTGLHYYFGKPPHDNTTRMIPLGANDFDYHLGVIGDSCHPPLVSHVHCGSAKQCTSDIIDCS